MKNIYSMIIVITTLSTTAINGMQTGNNKKNNAQVLSGINTGQTTSITHETLRHIMENTDAETRENALHNISDVIVQKKPFSWPQALYQQMPFVVTAATVGAIAGAALMTHHSSKTSQNTASNAIMGACFFGGAVGAVACGISLQTICADREKYNLHTTVSKSLLSHHE
jgi:hypothetical protein